MYATTTGTEVPNLSDEILENTVWFDPEELDYVPLEEREHSDAEIDHFQRTIYDYNGAQPIVVDCECRIVAGRGRVEAGWLLGVDEIPAIPLSSMSADDLDHYIKTMIRFAVYVGWSAEMLETDLQHLLVIKALMEAASSDTAAEIQ